MSEQTVQCKICGKPYVFHMHYAGDQSACPGCRERARRVNVGTIAHVDHGKTTLATAIRRACREIWVKHEQ